MDQSLIETLQKTGFFESLNSNDLEKITSIFHKKRTRKKDILFHEEEDCQAVYFIHTGRIKTYKTDEEGREKIINLLGEGEMFPHIGLFGGGRYPASAMVVEESTLFYIYVEDFLSLLEHNPSLSVKMLRVMEQKIRSLQEHLAGLLSRDIGERVWHILRGLAKASGTPTAKGVRLEMDLTHQDLASMVGTTRETITRLLGQFRKEGKLDIENGRLVLISE